VVRELDVFLSRAPAALGASLALMSQPLRPTWRPYDFERISRMQFKPVSKRLELDIPLDAGADTFDAACRPEQRTDKLTLRCSAVEQCPGYAIGVVKEDGLYLVPLEECMQLRPSMAYLAPPAKREEAKPEEEDGDSDGGGALPPASAPPPRRPRRWAAPRGGAPCSAGRRRPLARRPPARRRSPLPSHSPPTRPPGAQATRRWRCR